MCTPMQELEKKSDKFLFPILPSNASWRGSQYENGDMKSFELKNLQVHLKNDSELRATWAALPPEFGSSTAGVALVARNDSLTMGCGCAIDARWAKGTIFTDTDANVQYWQSIMGEPSTPNNSKFSRSSLEATLQGLFIGFFDEGIGPYLGGIIRADQAWLNSMAQQSFGTEIDEPRPKTPFEKLLSQMAWSSMNRFIPGSELDPIFNETRILVE